MTRKALALKNSKNKAKRNKQLVIGMVTGLYKDEYKKANGSWNINKIAEASHLSRQTVSKYLRVWESNLGGLFEDELCR